MKKRPHAKNTQYDWLIHYILKPIEKLRLFLQKVMGIIKTNTTKYYYKPMRGGGKEQRKKSEEKLKM